MIIFNAIYMYIKYAKLSQLTGSFTKNHFYQSLDERKLWYRLRLFRGNIENGVWTDFGR